MTSFTMSFTNPPINLHMAMTAENRNIKRRIVSSIAIYVMTVSCFFAASFAISQFEKTTGTPSFG